MYTLNSLNNEVLKEANKYLDLDILGEKIQTPYYINNIGNMFKELMIEKGVSKETVTKIHMAYKSNEIPFGWHRGKGTAEEIANAAEKIGEKTGLSLTKSTREGKRELMSLFGLGIDCSGLVFNILNSATLKNKLNEKFRNSLSWANQEKQGKNLAGVFVFSDNASYPISASEIRPLDILCFKSNHHIALLVEKDKKLKVLQSALTTSPSGVTLTNLEVTDGIPNFKFKVTIGPDWNELFKNEKIEFRRLRFLDE